MKPHRRPGAVAIEAVLVSAALSLGACSSSNEQPKSAAEIQSMQSDEELRLDKATDLLASFRRQVPDSVASRARCVVIVPSYKKAGLIVGGEGGKGFATCHSGSSWSSPAPVKMGGGTVGAQIGYESADVLALVVSDSAVKALEGGNFKVGVSASASAGPVGATAQKTGDVGVKSDILTYANSAGLFAGATFNGATISSDDDATQALYGKKVRLDAILERRQVLPQPPAVQRFLATVSSSFAPAAVSTIETGAAGPAAAAR